MAKKVTSPEHKTHKRTPAEQVKYVLTHYWQLYVFMSFSVIYLIIFDYYPMAGNVLAFKQYDYKLGIWGSPWVGFKHFERFLSNYMFGRLMWNTMRISVLSSFWGFPVPILFALCLNAMIHPRYKKTIQTITYMPHFISTVVMVGILKQFFNPRAGIYGNVIKMITGKMPGDIFMDPKIFDTLYIGSGIWQGFGWGSILYLAALSGVSPELHEAAAIDGATRWKRVIHIDVPSILPTITIMLIMNIGSILGVGYEKIYLMQTDMNIRVSEVISTYVYKMGLGSGGRSDYGFSTAVSLFNAVINIFLLIIANTISRKVGETSLW